MWQAMVGQFEFSARFFVSRPLTLIFFYIIYSSFHVQRAQLAQLVDKAFGNLWDLGSIPKSPMLFQYFCC